MNKVNAHSLVGVSDQYCWSQAQHLHTQESYAILVLSLRHAASDTVLDLASLGGVVFEKFHENGEKYANTAQWYTWAKQEMEDLEGIGIGVSLLIATVVEGKLWIWGSGDVTGLVKREGKWARLVGEGGFGEGVAGEVREADIYLLGTVSATTFALQALNAQVGETSELISENLAPSFYAQEKAADQALVIADIETVRSESDQVRKPYFTMPKLTIKRMSEEPRKFNLVVGGVVIGLLVALVLIGVVSRSRKIAKNEYETAIARSAAMVSDAESVAATNPERAKILLSQSKEVLETYIQTNPKADYVRKADEQLALIAQKENEVLRVRGTMLTPTIELAILANNLSAQSMQSDLEGSLFFWSESKRGFVGVNVADLSTVELAVENERIIGPFSYVDGTYYGMASGGVWRGKAKEQKIVIPTDETWGKIAQVATFGNNIYLLDTGMGEIWKYAATDNGYAERRRWFGKGVVLDLSKVVDWVVDGDVWLLTATGKLERYSRGVPVAFTLTGFASENEKGGFVNPVALTIVDEMIYVLEQGAKRVVAFKLDGTYVEQYVTEDFAKAKDLAVYKGKGYVLVDNIIKEWEL